MTHFNYFQQNINPIFDLGQKQNYNENQLFPIINNLINYRNTPLYYSPKN